MTEVGNRIKDVRIGMGYTQKELSDMAGISKTSLERMEKGSIGNFSNLISVLRQMRLADNLNMLIPEQDIRPSEIYNNTDRPQRVRKAKKSERQWKWGDEE